MASIITMLVFVLALVTVEDAYVLTLDGVPMAHPSNNGLTKPWFG